MNEDAVLRLALGLSARAASGNVGAVSAGLGIIPAQALQPRRTLRRRVSPLECVGAYRLREPWRSCASREPKSLLAPSYRSRSTREGPLGTPGGKSRGHRRRRLQAKHALRNPKAVVAPERGP